VRVGTTVGAATLVGIAAAVVGLEAGAVVALTAAVVAGTTVLVAALPHAASNKLNITAKSKVTVIRLFFLISSPPNQTHELGMMNGELKT
jgi:hypothetical protein